MMLYSIIYRTDSSTNSEQNYGEYNKCQCSNEEFLDSDVSSEGSEYSFTDSELTEDSTEKGEENKDINESLDEELNVGNVFKNKLRKWALKFHITLIALSALLLILQPLVSFPLPIDARTLLGTLRKVNISNMGCGEYYHFGVKRCVKSIIDGYKRMGKNVDEIKLVFNIDGLPIFKSSKESLWLILCSEINSQEVYPIGAYYGNKKPNDANQFIEEFITELVDLCKNGLEGECSQILCAALICDAPAKAFILYLKGHTGYNSCPKCCISGKYEVSKPKRKGKKAKGRVCFPGIGPFTLKTDEGFLLNKYNELEPGNETILKRIPNFGCVSSVTLDYMHLILLGVMKKLLRLWIMGPLSTRLSASKIDQISKKLLTLRHSITKEFTRKPRPLSHLCFWKATEFRTFLLYTGPLVLKNILPKEQYDNFILLHSAVTILISKLHMKSINNIDCAHEMLEQFVLDFQRIYGKQFVSYNVHNLLHLCDDAKKFGLLDNFSAFKFENYMTCIKRMVRKGDKPLEQIARRYSEREAMEKNYLPIERYICEQPHNTGPVTDDCKNVLQQYKLLKYESIVIDCNTDKDRYVFLKDGMFVKVLNIIKRDDDEIHLVAKPINSIGKVYENPDSRLLNIHIGEIQNNAVLSTSIDNILNKVWRVPTSQGIVMFTLPH